MKMKISFFVIFYVILGTTGITIPWLVNHAIIPSEVAIGLVTIVVSTVGYSAAEKVLQLFEGNEEKGSEERKKDKIVGYINLCALVFALIFTTIVCLLIGHPSALVISIIAYLLSCFFWWFQNRDNKNIEYTSTLGGDANQFN